MKRFITNCIAAIAFMSFLACTEQLIATGNTMYIIMMIYTLGIGIVCKLDLVSAWYKRAVLDNSMPLNEDGLTAEQYHQQMADNLEVQRLLNTDLGPASFEEYKAVKELDKYFTNKLHDRSINKKAAWDKILARINDEQHN